MKFPEGSNVLVCVTGQASSKKLIRTGVEIAKKYDVPVQVLSVISEEKLTDSVGAVMQELFDEANKFNAEMVFYFNDSPAITAAVHATKTNSIHVVSGTPGVGSNLFIEILKGLLPKLPLTLVAYDDKLVTFPGSTRTASLKTTVSV